MASLKHTKTAKINHQDHDVRFSRNKLSEALFLLSPHNFITEPPHPLLQHCLTDLSQAEQNWRQGVPTNLAPTATIWHYSPPTSPPAPCKMLPKTKSYLEFSWTWSFASKKKKKTIREKEQRTAGKDNLPWKRSLGLKMLYIIPVSHPSAAAALQMGVQITGAVWIRTCSLMMTSRSHRTDLAS